MPFFKKNPTKKLEKQVQAKFEEARDAQRAGDIQKFAILNEEAEDLSRQLDEARAAQA